MKRPLFTFIITAFSLHFYAQAFLNSDLNGTVAGSSCLPTSWQNVPDTDPASLASGVSQATSDLTDINGPLASNGIVGNPYSGATFTSGLMGGGGPSFFWHEGLMQTVSGFVVGCAYGIGFHQTVVKQSNTDYLDTSGAWAVYFDNTLAGVSASTISLLPVSSISKVWEYRVVTFTATATTHTIKFLPADDDPDQSTNNSLGGLRMGIDSIYILSATPSSLGNDTTICQGGNLLLNATATGATYLWQDNSTNPTFNVTQAGTYWVHVTNACNTFDDTITVAYDTAPILTSSSNLSICKGSAAYPSTTPRPFLKLL